MADNTQRLLADDKKYLWHPFTQMGGWQHEQPPVIREAQGSTLVDSDGRSYIDGVSSLWCNVHGHRHPQIDAAIRAQLDKVAHTTMLGLTHPEAIKLARRLAEIAPAGLQRVFYSDSGSTAVEIALKMAFQYWQQRGGAAKRKTRFISLEEAYHGDTLGSVSVGGIDLFHAIYRPLLFRSIKAIPGDAGHMERLLAENDGEVAAVMVEPLIQGAAGMLIHPDGYLAQVQELCNRHDVLLICDEVATGFGRTGTMFACEQEDVTPDLLCLAKGITGGYLPLAATLTSERIYDGFLGKYEQFRAFFHGHTYTGNPIACAAAQASLDIFEQERTLERLEPKIKLMAKLLEPVASMPNVAEVRQRGMMVGIELVRDADSRQPYEPSLRVGYHVALKARELGAIIRPLSDVVVLMPPLSTSERELERLVMITREAISTATREVEQCKPIATKQ